MINLFIDRLKTCLCDQSIVASEKLLESNFDEALVDKSYFERSASTVARLRTGSVFKGLYDSDPDKVGRFERLVRNPVADPAIIDVEVKKSESAVRSAVTNAKLNSLDYQEDEAITSSLKQSSPTVQTSSPTPGDVSS